MIRTDLVRNAADLPDPSHMAPALEAELRRLVVDWDRISRAQKDELVALVEQIAADGRLDDLLDLRANTAEAQAALWRSMRELGHAAADQVVAEARAQGVTLGGVLPDTSTLADVAAVVVALLAAELVVSASRAAMQANGPDSTPQDVAAAVRRRLDSLSMANAEAQLGGALHGAMNAARIATMQAGPIASIYASEVMDRGTCKPCRRVDGKFLGTSDQMALVERSYPSGGYGGFVDCEGGVRCRGTVVAVWRPQQVPEASVARWLLGVARTRTVLRNHPGHSSQKSHGRKKGSPEDLHDPAVIRATFSYVDEKTGLRASVTAIRPGGPGATEVEITIVDRDGAPAGVAMRTIEAPGRREVHADSIELDGPVQGQGFATRYNQRVEAELRDYGIERVRTYANIDVGGYSNARAGYDFADPMARGDVGDLARGMADRYPAHQEAILAVAGRRDFAPVEMAMVGHTPGAATWPGKEIMLESRWQGVKELGPAVEASLRWLLFGREYKRDKDGQFASGGGMLDDDVIQAAFTFTDEKTGMSASVTGIREGYGGARYVDIAIRNAAGERVGGGLRTISADGKTVSHSNLAINPMIGGKQGQGFATRFNAQAEGVYRANGVERIKLTAMGIGGYAWAKAGYDFGDRASRADIADIARGKADKFPTHRDAILAVAARPDFAPIDMAMVGWSPGAESWPGKDIMLNTMWDGVREL